MSLRIILRGKVLLAIVIFTTITCAGIIYTSTKSLQLDRKHLALQKLSKNINLEITRSRIYADDYFVFKDLAKETAVLNCFANTKKYIFALDSIIEAKNLGKPEPELRKALKLLDRQATQIQSMIAESMKNNAADINLPLLNNYHHFELAYQEFDKRIDAYIFRENLRFKNRAFSLIILSFFLLLFCIFLIYRIINSYNAIEKKQAIRSLEVEYKERKRIAADLHDGLGSILSSIVLYIQLLEKEHPTIGSNKSMQQVKELSASALENLEATIHNLNPSILNKYGLIKSLEIVGEKINDIGEVKCSIEASHSDMNLDPNVELNLYRICNELINNTLKHSKAKNLSINIQQIKKTLTILYRDNGKGFNPDIIYTSDEEKMGLRNIINRIESLGGQYAINSAEGKGVEIMLRLNV